MRGMSEAEKKFEWHPLYLLAAYYMRAQSIRAAMVDPYIRQPPAELGTLSDPYDDRSLQPNGLHIRNTGLLHYEAAAQTVIEVWLGVDTGFRHHDSTVDSIVDRMDLVAFRRYRNSVFHPAHADDARRAMPEGLCRNVHTAMDAIGNYIRANIPTD